MTGEEFDELKPLKQMFNPVWQEFDVNINPSIKKLLNYGKIDIIPNIVTYRS